MRTSLSIVYIIHQHCHRSSPCWTTRRTTRAEKHPVRTRMLVGITGSYRRANLTTRRRQVDVSEDNRQHCPIALMHSSRVYQFEFYSYATVHVDPMVCVISQSSNRRPSCAVVCIRMHRCITRTRCPGGERLVFRQPTPNSVHRVDAGEAG